MNTGVVVLVVVLGWSLLSVIVAMAVGAMAKARDAGAVLRPGQGRAPGRAAPAARDEVVRTAV
jgi:hypothetical protein